MKMDTVHSKQRRVTPACWRCMGWLPRQREVWLSVNDPGYGDTTCVKAAFPSLCQRKRITLRRRTECSLKPQWLQFWEARGDPISQQANWSVGAHLARVMACFGRSGGLWCCLPPLLPTMPS